jgi:hypothetical protein
LYQQQQFLGQPLLRVHAAADPKELFFFFFSSVSRGVDPSAHRRCIGSRTALRRENGDMRPRQFKATIAISRNLRRAL